MSLQPEDILISEIGSRPRAQARTLESMPATVAASAPSAPTMADFIRAADAVDAVLGKRLEALTNWMRGNGMPPETHLLFLPESYRELLPLRRPEYVRFHAMAKGPLIVSRFAFQRAGGSP